MSTTRIGLYRGWLALLPAVVIAGCLPASQTQQQTGDFFSQFPPVSLSSTIIHSPSGDMTARLPQEWVSIDVEELGDAQIFSVICDPLYTMSVIFNEVPLDAALRTAFDKGGMKGLMEASFTRRQRRSGGGIQNMAEPEQFTIGERRFGAYMYTTDSMRTITRVAVFFTNYHLYECSITHLTFSTHDLPEPRALRDIHQTILGGIEW